MIQQNIILLKIKFICSLLIPKTVRIMDKHISIYVSTIYFQYSIAKYEIILKIRVKCD